MYTYILRITVLEENSNHDVHFRDNSHSSSANIKNTTTTISKRKRRRSRSNEG